MHIADEALMQLGVKEDTMKHMAHAIYMFMNHYTAGHTKEVIQHRICNGIDAWRKLYMDQLPLAEGKRNMRMT